MHANIERRKICAGCDVAGNFPGRFCRRCEEEVNAMSLPSSAYDSSLPGFVSVACVFAIVALLAAAFWPL